MKLQRDSLFSARGDARRPAVWQHELAFAAVAGHLHRGDVHAHVDGARRRGHVAFHPLESAERGLHAVGGEARLRRLDAEVVPSEQVDRARAPRVAQAPPERPTVHGVDGVARLGRVVELPEARRAVVEHAAPVGADLIQDVRLAADRTERLQFVEAHVGRLDRQDVLAEDPVRDGPFAARLVEVAVEEAEHVRVLGELGALPSVPVEGVDERAAFFAPERRHDLRA